MAHGKSLELQKIEIPAPEPLCSCGLVWGKHFKKDGAPLKKYEDKMYREHFPAGRRGAQPFTRKR